MRSSDDGWNEWNDDEWMDKGARPASRVGTASTLQPFVYTPPSQPACCAPHPLGSAQWQPPAAIPGAPGALSAPPTRITPQTPGPMPLPQVPSKPVPFSPRTNRDSAPSYGEWTAPLTAATQSAQSSQSAHHLRAPYQEQFSGDPLVHQAASQLLGGLAAGVASGMGGQLASGIAGLGQDNAAMQQVATGVALNYLGGLSGSVNSEVKTYTNSKLAMVRYYFQVRFLRPVSRSTALESNVTAANPNRRIAQPSRWTMRTSFRS